MQLLHIVFEPAGDGPRPTLLTLHGWGANAFDLLGVAPYICGGKFLVLCPQGPIQVPLSGTDNSGIWLVSNHDEWSTRCESCPHGTG